MSLTRTRRTRGLRILHVVRQYPPAVGGLEEYVARLVARQRSYAHTTVLTLDRIFGSPQALKRIERVNGTVVVRTPFLGFARFFLPMLSPAFLRRFDIVHVHALDQLGDVVGLLRRLGGPPFVLTSHGLFFHTSALTTIKRLYFRTISKATLASADAVFAVSQTDKDKLAEIAIGSRLLPNPVEPFPFLYRGSPDLVYWGRLAENKEIARLIPFHAELVKTSPERRLHIVGSGDRKIRARVAEAIASTGLEGKVVCHDFLERDRLAELIAQCGYAVSASRYEGYGLAQVEAMSAGLLPVMQPNSAFRELHEASGCGLLVDFADPVRAADAFRQWEATQADADHLRARSFALTRDWNATASQIEAAYRTILLSQLPSITMKERRYNA